MTDESFAPDEFAALVGADLWAFGPQPGDGDRAPLAGDDGGAGIGDATGMLKGLPRREGETHKSKSTWLRGNWLSSEELSEHPARLLVIGVAAIALFLLMGLLMHLSEKREDDLSESNEDPPATRYEPARAPVYTSPPTDGRGKKCGNSYIAANKTCHK